MSLKVFMILSALAPSVILAWVFALRPPLLLLIAQILMALFLVCQALGWLAWYRSSGNQKRAWLMTLMSAKLLFLVQVFVCFILIRQGKLA